MRTRALILPVNLALLVVGLADLSTTVFWLCAGRAVEFNPVMAAVLQLGMLAFVMVKLSTLAVYVGVMEWYRRSRNAAFAQIVGNITVTAYLAIYAVSFCAVNHGFLTG